MNKLFIYVFVVLLCTTKIFTQGLTPPSAFPYNNVIKRSFINFDNSISGTMTLGNTQNGISYSFNEGNSPLKIVLEPETGPLNCFNYYFDGIVQLQLSVGNYLSTSSGTINTQFTNTVYEHGKHLLSSPPDPATDFNYNIELLVEVTAIDNTSSSTIFNTSLQITSSANEVKNVKIVLDQLKVGSTTATYKSFFVNKITLVNLTKVNLDNKNIFLEINSDTKLRVDARNNSGTSTPIVEMLFKTNNNNDYISSNTFNLENMNEVYYYNISSSPSSTTTYGIFEWSLSDICQEYTPYLFQVQILKLENLNEFYINTSGSLTSLYSVVDWDKALTFEVKPYKVSNSGTSHFSLKDYIPTERSGFYTWRVRPVGNYYEGGLNNPANFGEWASIKVINGSNTMNHQTYKQNNIIDFSNSRKFCGYYFKLDESLNWTHTRIFSEGSGDESQFHDEMQYYNSSLQAIQQQKRIPSQNSIILQQNITDKQGRIAVQSLPINVERLGLLSSGSYSIVQNNPYSPANFKYKKNVFPIIGTSSIASYDYTQFDNGYGVPTPLGASSTGYSSGLLNEYYNGDDNLGVFQLQVLQNNFNIPTADGYPFVRTIFSNDGLSIPIQQSLPGSAHRIRPLNDEANSKTIKKYFTSASKQELVAFFGAEYPNPASVIKEINVDPNNITTYTYKNFNNQVIATALRVKGSNVDYPTYLTPSSYTGTQGRYQDLIEYSFSDIKKNKNVFELKAGPIKLPGLVDVQYNIDYSIPVFEFNPSLCSTTFGSNTYGFKYLPGNLLSMQIFDARSQEFVPFFSSSTILTSLLPSQTVTIPTNLPNQWLIPATSSPSFNTFSSNGEPIFALNLDIQNIEQLKHNLNVKLDDYFNSFKNEFKLDQLLSIVRQHSNSITIAPHNYTNIYNSFLSNLASLTLTSNPSSTIWQSAYSAYSLPYSGSGTTSSFTASINGCFDLNYLNLDCESPAFNAAMYSSSTYNFVNDIVDNIYNFITNKFAELPANQNKLYIYYTDFSGAVDFKPPVFNSKSQNKYFTFEKNESPTSIKNKIRDNIQYYFYIYNMPLTSHDLFVFNAGYSNAHLISDLNIMFHNLINDACIADVSNSSTITGQNKIFVKRKIKEFIDNFSNIIQKATEDDINKKKIKGGKYGANNTYEYGSGGIGQLLINCEINTFDMLLQDLNTKYKGLTQNLALAITKPYEYIKDPTLCRIQFKANHYSPTSGYPGDVCGTFDAVTNSFDLCDNVNSTPVNNKQYYRIYQNLKGMAYNTFFSSFINENMNRIANGTNDKSTTDDEKKVLENQKALYDKFNINSKLLKTISEGGKISKDDFNNISLNFGNLINGLCDSKKFYFESKLRSFLYEQTPPCYIEGDVITDKTSPSIADNPRLVTKNDLEFLINLMMADCQEYAKVEYTLNSTTGLYEPITNDSKKKYLDALLKGKPLTIKKIHIPNKFFRAITPIPTDFTNNPNCFFETNSNKHSKNYALLIQHSKEISALLNTKLEQIKSALPSSFEEQMRTKTRLENYKEIIDYLENDILTQSKYSYIKNYFRENAYYDNPNTAFALACNQVENNPTSKIGCEGDFGTFAFIKLVSQYKFPFECSYYGHTGSGISTEINERKIPWINAYKVGLLNSISILNQIEFNTNNTKIYSQNGLDYITHDNHFHNDLGIYASNNQYELHNVHQNHMYTAGLRFLLTNANHAFSAPRYSFNAEERITNFFSPGYTNSHVTTHSSILSTNSGTPFTHIGTTWQGDNSKKYSVNGMLIKGVPIKFNTMDHELVGLFPVKHKYHTVSFTPIFLGFKPGATNADCNNIFTHNTCYSGTCTQSEPSNTATGFCSIVYQFESIPAIDPATARKARCLDNQLKEFEEQIFTKYFEYKDKITNYAYSEYDNYIKNLSKNVKLKLNVKIDENLEQVTLYYYDRAGNLTRTVPPKGVDLVNSETDFPQHSYVTFNHYNSKGQLIKSDTPDESQFNNFVYSRLGNLKFSQTARQKTQNAISYLKYDKLMRVVESGQLTPSSASSSMLNFLNESWAYSNTINAIVNKIPNGIDNNRHFPECTESGTVLPIQFQYNSSSLNLGLKRNFLIKTDFSTDARIPGFYGIPPLRTHLDGHKVNYQMRDEDGDLTSKGDQVITYYSYDMHGNVDFVVQDIPATNNGDTRLFATTGYEYDLISKKVKKVFYNYYQSDSYVQSYEYDEDNRLKKVRTGRYGYMWDEDARYSYAPHGPLARVELGHDRLQGIDYTYTIQGWLKAINNINPARTTALTGDPGFDGVPTSVVSASSYTYTFPIDAYSQVLNYYRDIEGSQTISDFSTNKSTNLFTDNNQFNKETTFKSLYNGNIASWSADYTTTKPTNQAKIDHLFEYDYTNRLLSANAYNRSSSNTVSTWASASNTLASNYSYDRNGNIINMQRYDADGNILDNLEYNYNTNNNQLNYITDAAITGLRDDDLESQTLTNNYQYDASGNLIIDQSENINGITWTPDGKVRTVKNVKYLYDASGNRIMKRVDGDNLNTYTLYARDANSQVMAVYSRTTTDITDNANPEISNCITLKFKIVNPTHGCVPEIKICSDNINIHPSGKSFNFNNSVSFTMPPPCNYTGEIPASATLTLQPKERWGEGFTPNAFWASGHALDIDIPITLFGNPSTTQTSSATIRNDISVANIWLMPKISEWHIYGNGEQGRFAIKKPDNGTSIYYLGPLENDIVNMKFSRILGSKEYELKDHLGNVRTVISDFKQPATLTQARGVPPFIVDERSVNDYYPYGMLIPERSWSSSDYRYGYNTQEKSLEIDPNGNHNTAEFWEYDARSGRRWNRDPKPITGISDYATFAGNPILHSDALGDSINLGNLYDKDKKGNLIHRSDVQAFEAFAMTKEGRKWISERAHSGFKLQGEIYKDLNIDIKEEGNLSKQGIDYKITMQNDGNFTYAAVKGNRVDVTVNLQWATRRSYTKEEYSKAVMFNLETFLHEAFYHGNNFEKQFLGKKFTTRLDKGLNKIEAEGHDHVKHDKQAFLSLKNSLYGKHAIKIIKNMLPHYPTVTFDQVFDEMYQGHRWPPETFNKAMRQK